MTKSGWTDPPAGVTELEKEAEVRSAASRHPNGWYKLEPHNCWHCQTLIVGSSTLPPEGDVSVCVNCGEIAAFHDGKFIEPTPDERLIAAADPKVQRTLRALPKIKLLRALGVMP